MPSKLAEELYLQRLRAGIAAYLGGRDALNRRIAASQEAGKPLARLINITVAPGGQCQGCGHHPITYRFHLVFDQQVAIATGVWQPNLPLVVGSECIKNYVSAAMAAEIEKTVERLKRSARKEANTQAQAAENADLFAWLRSGQLQGAARDDREADFLDSMVDRLRERKLFTDPQLRWLRSIYSRWCYAQSRRPVVAR